MPVNVAIVGISSSVGLVLAAQCDADVHIRTIVGIDVTAPHPLPEKCNYVRAQPGDDLRSVFQDHKIARAIYLSPFPTGRVAVEPDEEPGLAAFLEAAGAASPKAMVVLSGPFAYDASEDGQLCTEGAALRADQGGFGSKDLVRENAVARFARKHKSVAVAICRLAPVVGPGTEGIASLLLSTPKIPTIAGKQPQLQFVHIDDAGLAAFRLLRARRNGAYNLAPDDTVSLAEVGRCLKRPLQQVSSLKARVLAGTAEILGMQTLGGINRALLPLLSRSVRLANRKLKRDLGYRFKYACNGAISDHARRRATL
ncbi:hypothetical protein ACFL59_02055 [Planctomycetota bacterium]